MKVIVNLVEAASDLACEFLIELQQEALNKNPKDLPFPNGIIKEREDGTIVYTQEAQKIYNRLYIKVLSVLKNQSKKV